MDSKLTNYERASRHVLAIRKKEIERARKSNKNIDKDVEMALSAGYIDYLDHLKNTDDPKPAEFWLDRSIQVALNTGLIKLVLHRLKNLVKDTPDAEEIAGLALVKAVDTFDPTKGFAFSTLAYRIIVNEIIAASKKNQRELVEDQPVPTYSDQSLILVKVSNAVGVRKVFGLSHKTFYDLQFLDMNQEDVFLDRIFDFDCQKHPIGSLFKKGDLIGWHLQPEYKPLSLDQDYRDDENNRTSLADEVKDKQSLVEDVMSKRDQEITRTIVEAMGTLSRTEQAVFKLSFPLSGQRGLGIAKIADLLEISSGRVKTARDRSQILIRQALKQKGLNLEDFGSMTRSAKKVQSKRSQRK